MSEIVLRLPTGDPRGLELVFDDADIVAFQSPRDTATLPCAAVGCMGCPSVHRVVLNTHLTLSFAPGKAPQWRRIQT